MGRRAKGEGSITQHKSGHWQAEFLLGYDDAGKRKRKFITGKTQNEVRAKLDALKRDHHNGIYSDTKLTVKQYLTDWLETKKRQVEPKTLEGYTRTAKHLTRHLGAVQLAKLTPTQIQRTLGAIADESAATVARRNGGVAPGGAGVRTANQCRTNFHTALQDAVRMQLLARNPVAATKPLKAATVDLVIWNPEQVRHFLNVTGKHPLHTLFLLTVGSGLRRGELLGLRWQDIGTDHVTVKQTVKLANGKVIVGPPKTKNGTRRVVVTDDIISALMTHKAKAATTHPSDLVFSTRLGTPIDPRNLAHTFCDLQDKARVSLPELPRTRFHALRHFHASLAICGGMNPKMLADRLGHSNISITLDTYTHLWDEQRTASAVDISALLTPPAPAYAN